MPQTISDILNATVVGRGEKTLVLANGLGTNQHTWRHIIAEFADEYRIVRFDYVGSPDSTIQSFESKRYATLHGHADDAIALLDELRLSGATWVGHSDSGAIGMLIAAAAPELIEQLVLIAASPRYLDDAGAAYTGGFTRSAIEEMLAAAKNDFHGWVDRFSPTLIGVANDTSSIEELAANLRRLRSDVAYETLSTILLSDHRDIASRVRQRVAVIQPRADLLVPSAVGRYLARKLPRAELIELHASGHMPHLTAPREVSALLRSVLLAPALAA